MTVVLTQTDLAKGIQGTPYPDDAGAVCAIRAAVTVPDTAVATHIFEMLRIPPGCRVIDVILDSDDLDSGSPAITLDVGFMSGTPGDADIARTVGAEFFSGSTVAQAGGLARPTLKTAVRDAVSASERAIGIKIAVSAATAVEGIVGLTAYYATE